MPTYPLSGSCFCGAVPYRLLSAPMFVNCCHCRDCQRQSGGAFIINAVIETDLIALLAGSPVPVSVLTESGQPHDIYRCPVCQTALWSDYGRRPAIRFVRVTTLDDPSAFPPNAHTYTRSKLPWVVLPPGVPAFEEYYDMAKLYPPESLARRRAILGDE
ncbi:MAG TPA: GFA family protein [Rhizomicrobium sp.]